MRVAELGKKGVLGPSHEEVGEVVDRVTSGDVDTVVMDIDTARVLEGWEWQRLLEAGLTTVTITSELA